MELRLSEEASIHTAEITAIKIVLKEIYKREDKRWVLYTDFQSSMQSIKYNEENHLILNQICDIQVVLQNQIILCKVLAHIGIKGSNEAYKEAK